MDTPRRERFWFTHLVNVRCCTSIQSLDPPVLPNSSAVKPPLFLCCSMSEDQKKKSNFVDHKSIGDQPNQKEKHNKRQHYCCCPTTSKYLLSTLRIQPFGYALSCSKRSLGNLLSTNVVMCPEVVYLITTHNGFCHSPIETQPQPRSFAPLTHS